MLSKVKNYTHYIVVMKRQIETIINTKTIENKFIFKQEIHNISRIKDDEGTELGFYRNENGNQVIFTKDDEGLDVAIEHTTDGAKIFHLQRDSKGLPAMHELRPDGSETMYLLDSKAELEKMIETRANGDKLTYWFYYENEILIQEERQNGGILFKLIGENSEALIWLHTDGHVESFGAQDLLKRLHAIFIHHLDGVEV